MAAGSKFLASIYSASCLVSDQTRLLFAHSNNFPNNSKLDSPHCAAVDSTPLHLEADHADVQPSRTITKARARTLTQQIAYILRTQYGIRPQKSAKDSDSVVAVFSAGQSMLPCLFYGVLAAGGVYCAGNDIWSKEEISWLLHGLGTRLRAVICSAELSATVLAAANVVGGDELTTKVLVLTSWPDWTLSRACRSPAQELLPRCDFDDLSPEMRLPWKVITDPEQLEKTTACVLFSSGITGKPKGKLSFLHSHISCSLILLTRCFARTTAVALSHANMVAEAYLPATINRPIWQAANPPFEIRTLSHLPPSFISGVQGCFINPFFDGGTVYWMSRMDLPAFLRHAETFRITTFFTIPPLYAAIAMHPAIAAGKQLASVEIAYSGGSQLKPNIRQAASAKLGTNGLGRFGCKEEHPASTSMATWISQTWGMTETCGAVTHMPPDRRDGTSSVSYLLPNIEMRLVDDQGQDVPSGIAGEALLRGPVVSKGYYPLYTVDSGTSVDGAAPSPFLPDSWFRTGDMMRMGDNGLVYFVDRKVVSHHSTLLARHWRSNSSPLIKTRTNAIGHDQGQPRFAHRAFRD
jgi:4-coumarate--CoA ligase